jgi:multicomponent Na+:H+ antiporter subunit C
VSSALLFALTGAGLIGVGLYALIVHAHLLRKVLAFNVLTSGVFLILIGLGQRGPGVDPVPQAMVLTGIVVAVAATALALALILALRAASGRTRLDDRGQD